MVLLLCNVDDVRFVGPYMLLWLLLVDLCVLLMLFCRAVRGVDVDGISYLLASGGSDGKVVLWNMKTQKPIKSIRMTSGVAKLRVHRESSMCAIALDDFRLCVVDLETKRVVRKFPGKRS